MTKTEKFWNLVEGLCSPVHFGFPIASVIGDVKEQRRCILLMQYIPSSFFEETRKRRLSVTVYSAAQWSEDFSPYSYVEVWLTPDVLRWR